MPPPRRALLLKRKLGLTAWREFSDDMREGVARLQVRTPQYYWAILDCSVQASPGVQRITEVMTEWERGWAGLRSG